jgi:anti-sigma regulatory factor (Ser/Thr protein kinase)
MPYHRCPACGLTGYYSAATWSNARSCANCAAPLGEDSRVSLTGTSNELVRTLYARPLAAAQARHTIAGVDAPEATRDALAFAVTELVTNAVRHAGSSPGDAVALRVTTDPDRVRVAVKDSGRGFDPSALGGPPDALTTGGRGLVIVAALASAWGVERDAGGCTVWCEVQRNHGRAAAPAEAPQETLCERPQPRYALV